MKRRETGIRRKPLTYTTTKTRVQTTVARDRSQPYINWDEAPEAEMPEQIFGRVRQIKNAQVTRRFELFTYQQAYNSRFGPAISASLFSPATRNPSVGQFALSANVIKSCVDAACARIAKSKPRAFVLPNKGDYRLKKKCKDLTKFLDGAMQSANVYANADEVFRDACIYGDGALILSTDDGELCSHVGKVDEIHIDEVQGTYGQTKEAHWSHAVSRRELIAKYPECAAEIEQARTAWRGQMAYMGTNDMVEVVRSWRLPSKKGGDDGCYVTSIATKVLKKVPWNKDYLPIFRFHWTPPTYGSFGDGIAKELFGMQRTLTDVLRGVVKSIRMFAVPRVWLQGMGTPGQVQLTNEISVNTYNGTTPPVFETPAAASPDIYNFIQWIIDWCFKQLGLSQLTAQSEKPAGLNSGVAMRTYQDVETQRFALVGQRWERWYMAVATAMIDMAGDLYKELGKLTVKVAGRGFIETIDWSDVSLKKDQYDVAVWPTNILPEQPEGRLQAIQEYVQSGFMPFEVAIGQLNLPVLNDWVDQTTAARENIESALSLIINEGQYVPPDGIGNVDLAVQLSQSEYLRAAIAKKVDPRRIELLLRYMNRALELKVAKDTPPAPPTGAAPPGQPGPVVGQAAAPPTAPLAPQGAGPIQAAAA